MEKVEKQEIGTPIMINKIVHGKFKMFCKGKALKVGLVTEDLIQLFVDEYDTVRKLIETNKSKPRK